jgi:hypothetical protein
MHVASPVARQECHAHPIQLPGQDIIGRHPQGLSTDTHFASSNPSML